ncbi:MAG: CDP-alcohol phosphatidyltransferase family protein [Rhodospirillaceae bacterium]|nr:CDP-alcohol phosphatidyltransferase family protein [Rhodospirillaceae bacterium]
MLIVKPLEATSVTPNHLTALRLAAGLSAAGLLAVGAAPWVDWAAGLFVLSMLLDRADGDLARITGRTSPAGHTYDLIADSLCNTLIFVGLGFGLRGGEYGYWAVSMGIAAGASVAAILWLVLRIERVKGARAAEIEGVAGFDPDDAMAIIPLAIWLGWSQGLLIAAAIGAPAFAVFFYWLFLRKRKSVSSDHSV